MDSAYEEKAYLSVYIFRARGSCSNNNMNNWVERETFILKKIRNDILDVKVKGSEGFDKAMNFQIYGR